MYNNEYSNYKPQILNKVKTRKLILSPAVKAGLEREACKTDFESLDDKSLGKGGFGSVWKVRHKVTKEIYAIKVINKESIIKQNLVEQTNREIQIMYKLDHPYIIKLYSHFEDDEDFCLIEQYAGKGQLYSLIKRLKRLDQKTAAQYMREIISAIKYLHTRNPPIIHRDIKPENVLLDNDGKCKLCDFGWSNFDLGHNNRETYCGTPEYLAPEMINKSGHDESVDIWALGVLLFELLTGRTPFNNMYDTNQLYSTIKSGRIIWTDDFPPLAKDLISRILRLNPKERLSLDQIINHPWFTGLPIITPIQIEYNYDEKQKLESHLIQSIPLNDSTRIKSKDINKENITKAKIDLSNSNYNNMYNINHINKNPGLINSNINPIIEVNNRLIKKDNNNYNLNNNNSPKYIEPSNNINNDLNASQMIASSRNQIRVDKIKYEKEIRELNELKEDNNKKNKDLFELKKLLEKTKNELNNLKVRNKERTSLVNELEEKSNKYNKIESDYKLLKIDYEQLKKENSNNKSNYDDLLIKYENMKINYQNLNTKFNKLESLKNEEISMLEDKLKNLEKTLIINEANTINNNKSNNDSSINVYSNNSNNNNTNNMIKLTADKINDLFKLLKNRFPLIESKIIENEKKEIQERKNMNEYMENKIQLIINDFQKIKGEIQNESQKLLNKKIQELTKENKNLMTKMSEIRNKENESSKSVRNLNITTNKNNNNQNENINEMNNRIKELEQLVKLTQDSKNVAEEKYKIQESYSKTIKEKYTKMKEAKDTYKNFLNEAKDCFKKQCKKDLKDFIRINDYEDPDPDPEDEVIQ